MASRLESKKAKIEQAKSNNQHAPLFWLVPQMVQLLSLSEFVLQPQASQVHRCPPEPDTDDSPPPSDGKDDSPLLLADLSIFEKGCKHTSNRLLYTCVSRRLFLLQKRYYCITLDLSPDC
jgi:hypothetical protein